MTGTRYRHTKSGGEYGFIGIGKVHVVEPLIDMERVRIYRDTDNNICIGRGDDPAPAYGRVQARDPLKNGESVIVYQGVGKDNFWVRRETEFNERFTEIGD